jgi:hypothetical protein
VATTSSKPKPKSLAAEQRELFDAIAKRIPDMTSEELASLFTDLQPLRAEDTTTAEEEAEKSAALQRITAPKNDDELHALILEETGYDIPRVAVCDDHCAPFDPIADAYFNREPAILVMASREGGKTIGISVLQYINAETKPGIEGVTFGAIKRQAEQAYKYVKSFVFTRDANGNRVPKPQIDGEPTREKTEWKTGSQILIIVGTKSGVNSPHPQTVHADELDLMDPEVFAESRSMSSSKNLPGGKRIPAIDIVTSTRKSSRGPMQKLIDEIEIAERDGHRPAWKLYAYCFREAAAEAPNCRCADPIARVRRLLELNMDPNQLCECVAPDTDVEILGGALAGYRRLYRGPLVDLLTVRGKKLSVTPNHPILTDHGWVAAGLLKKGDHVVSRSRSNASMALNLDEVHSAQDVYAALEVAAALIDPSPGSISYSISPLAVDFHGDGAYTEGEVELVSTELGLTSVVDPAVVKQIGEDIFTPRVSSHDPLLTQSSTQRCVSDPEFSGECRAVVATHVSGDQVSWDVDPSSLSIIAHISQETSSDESALQGVEGDICLGGECRGSFPVDVSVDDDLRDFVLDWSAASSQNDPPLDEACLEGLLRDSGLVDERGHSLAGDVSLDEIVDVRDRLWSGHVYNFSTTVGAYIAGGIVTHNCDKIVKGEWEAGVPRTLESVCRGDLFRSRGWMHKDDIDRKFTMSSQAYWEAQMECRRPMADGLYLPSFSRPRHCVRAWVPRPQYGRVSMGVDWGGGDASLSVVVWVQGPTVQPIEVMGFSMKPIVVPQGAYVVFKTLYFGRIGASKMADQVVTAEIGYKEKYPGWRCRGRFADMAGAQQRNDWHEHNPPLRTSWFITRDFDPTIETVQNLMSDNLLYVDITNCAEMADDFEGWRQKDGKEVHDDSSHGPAALRYDLTNVVVVERRRENEQGKRAAMPAVRERGLDNFDNAGLSAAVGSTPTGQPVETEAWRRSIGMMTSNLGSDGWRI